MAGRRAARLEWQLPLWLSGGLRELGGLLRPLCPVEPQLFGSLVGCELGGAIARWDLGRLFGVFFWDWGWQLDDNWEFKIKWFRIEPFVGVEMAMSGSMSPKFGFPFCRPFHSSKSIFRFRAADAMGGGSVWMLSSSQTSLPRLRDGVDVELSFCPPPCEEETAPDLAVPQVSWRLSQNSVAYDESCYAVVDDHADEVLKMINITMSLLMTVTSSGPSHRHWPRVSGVGATFTLLHMPHLFHRGYQGSLCMGCGQGHFAAGRSCVECSGEGLPSWLIKTGLAFLLATLFLVATLVIAYAVYSWHPGQHAQDQLPLGFGLFVSARSHLSSQEWLNYLQRSVFAPGVLGCLQQRLGVAVGVRDSPRRVIHNGSFLYLFLNTRFPWNEAVIVWDVHVLHWKPSWDKVFCYLTSPHGNQPSIDMHREDLCSRSVWTMLNLRVLQEWP